MIKVVDWLMKMEVNRQTDRDDRTIIPFSYLSTFSGAVDPAKTSGVMLIWTDWTKAHIKGRFRTCGADDRSTIPVAFGI
jgi:hypothetical protein